MKEDVVKLINNCKLFSEFIDSLLSHEALLFCEAECKLKLLHRKILTQYYHVELEECSHCFAWRSLEELQQCEHDLTQITALTMVVHLEFFEEVS